MCLPLFVLNGLVIAFLAEVLLRLRISPRVFIAFMVYVIAIEEVFGAFTWGDGFLRGYTSGANIT